MAYEWGDNKKLPRGTDPVLAAADAAGQRALALHRLRAEARWALAKLKVAEEDNLIETRRERLQKRTNEINARASRHPWSPSDREIAVITEAVDRDLGEEREQVAESQQLQEELHATTTHKAPAPTRSRTTLALGVGRREHRIGPSRQLLVVSPLIRHVTPPFWSRGHRAAAAGAPAGPSGGSSRRAAAAPRRSSSCSASLAS